MRRESPKLLEDIRDAAQYIVGRTANDTLESFRANRDVRHIAERNFEIIGEATRRLERSDPDTARRLTDHRRMIDFRNYLIHAYDGVDATRVWRTIVDFLPVLLTEVTELLQEADKEGSEDGGRR